MLTGINDHTFFSKEGFISGSGGGNYKEAFTGTVLDKEAFTVDQLDDLSAQLANDLPMDENSSLPTTIPNIGNKTNNSMEVMEENAGISSESIETDNLAINAINNEMNSSVGDNEVAMGTNVSMDDATTSGNNLDMDDEIVSEENEMEIPISDTREGFVGSTYNGMNSVAGILKAVLMGLLFYILSHPRTYKLMTPVNKFIGNNLGVSKEFVHSAIFFLVAWIVYMS